ncbi:MAG: class II aldolase/adducin family protein [Planctomycetes bacterium]|nr:class II aldolase/adducin family protein [Planctomycetota bacterium]
MTAESPEITIARLKREIVAACHRMYAQHFIVATDGNVSVRIAEDELMITRSGICKGEMTEADVITVDFEGRVLEGDGRPSSETFMHIAAYEERPDIAAIVHAHPPTAVAFTIAGVSLAQCVIPEVVLTMGTVPTVPYTTPTTKDVPLAVRAVIRHADALMLERHGAVCVGLSPKDAFFKLEKLEHAAHVTWLAQQLGQVQLLPPDEVRRLLALRSKFDLAGRNPLANDCIAELFDS